jgi:hypothetical protein
VWAKVRRATSLAGSHCYKRISVEVLGLLYHLWTMVTTFAMSLFPLVLSDTVMNETNNSPIVPISSISHFMD